MKPGYCTEVDYIRAVDGDTVEVELRRRFKIRLKDINTPEKKTDEGMKALEFVDTILNNASKILINIDLGDTLKLMDFNSFERIVADIEVDGKDLKNLLISNGYNK